MACVRTVKIDPNTVRFDDVRIVRVARVHQLIERHRHGEAFKPIKITRNGVLLDGEHELTAAQILRLREIDAVVAQRVPRRSPR